MLVTILKVLHPFTTGRLSVYSCICSSLNYSLFRLLLVECCCGVLEVVMKFQQGKSKWQNSMPHSMSHSFIASKTEDHFTLLYRAANRKHQATQQQKHSIKQYLNTRGLKLWTSKLSCWWFENYRSRFPLHNKPQLQFMREFIWQLPSIAKPLKMHLQFAGEGDFSNEINSHGTISNEHPHNYIFWLISNKSPTAMLVCFYHIKEFKLHSWALFK